MHPFIKATACLFWRERRFSFALFIIIASAFSIFMRQFNPLFEKYQAMQVMIIFALFIELFSLSLILLISGLGSHVMPLKIPDHLYVKPVSSRFLVTFYLGLSILSVVLVHLIAVLLYRFVGHLDWPVIIPLICLISLTLCLYAVFWKLSEVPFLCVIAISILCGFFSAFSMEFILKRQVSLQYFLLNIMPYLLIIDIFAIAISFHAVKHARCGERLRSASFWERLYVWLSALLPGKNWKLQTPQKAYFWLLLRTTGLTIPLINLLFVFIALILLMSLPEYEKAEEMLGFMGTCALINLFMLPFLGGLMAHQEDKTYGVSYFIAARPISNRSILLAILKAFIASYIIGWIIYLIGVIITVIWLRAEGIVVFPKTISDELEIQFLSFLPIILVYPLGFWAAIGLTGSICISGRKWLIFLFVSLLFMIPVFGLLSEVQSDVTIRRILLIPPIWLFAIGSIGGTLSGFICMVRRQMMSLKQAGFLIAAYCICLFIFLRFNLVSIDEGLTETAFYCGLLVLPFAPLAAAPLALAWNRHR